MVDRFHCVVEINSFQAEKSSHTDCIKESFLFTDTPPPAGKVLYFLNTGYWIQDASLETGYWIKDTGYWMQDTEYRIQDTGYRSSR